MAPRKVRACAELMKGLKINEARTQLLFSKRRAARPLLKLLNSYLDNLKKNLNFNQEKINNLYIKVIRVDEGSKLKRWRPVARGSAHPIQKKTSHITIVFEERKTPESQIQNSKPRRKAPVSLRGGQIQKTKIQNSK